MIEMSVGELVVVVGVAKRSGGKSNGKGNVYCSQISWMLWIFLRWLFMNRLL